VLKEFYSLELIDIDSGYATSAATINFIAKTIHTISITNRSSAILNLLNIEIKRFVRAVSVSAYGFSLTSAVIS
jgi:enoyl-[acyl-carrier-protein] reductase (NADH)